MQAITRQWLELPFHTHLGYAIMKDGARTPWSYNGGVSSSRRKVQPSQLVAKLDKILQASDENRRPKVEFDYNPDTTEWVRVWTPDPQEAEIEIESMVRSANNIYWPNSLKVTLDELKQFVAYSDFENAYNNVGLCPVSVMQNYCYKGVFGKNGPLVYSEALRVIQELMELYNVDDW